MESCPLASAKLPSIFLEMDGVGASAAGAIGLGLIEGADI